MTRSGRPQPVVVPPTDPSKGDAPTMSTIPTPLVMLGTGGDYVARYFVKGAALAKQVGQSLEQQPDTETAGSFAGYHRHRHRA